MNEMANWNNEKIEKMIDREMLENQKKWRKGNEGRPALSGRPTAAAAAATAAAGNERESLKHIRD